MGTIRTLLAISVVFGHANFPWYFTGGAIAVKMFYIVSGFLVSFVLSQDIYRSTKTFYLNRYLRLWPAYLAVASLALISRTDFFPVLKTLPTTAQILLSISNASIIGSDLVMFSAIRDGQFFLTGDFRNSEPVLSGFLLISPAWTLGVELWFYFFSPLLHRSLKIATAALALSVIGRLIAIKLGWGSVDPWSYRFFPFEISLFILGMLIHKLLYARFDFYKSKRVSLACFAFSLISILTFGSLPGSRDQQILMLFIPFILMIPGLFSFQFFYKWDRSIGELSYPIYLCHLLVIAWTESIFPDAATENGAARYILITTGTILFALMIKISVIDPVEGLRKKVRERNLAPSN